MKVIQAIPTPQNSCNPVATGPRDSVVDCSQTPALSPGEQTPAVLLPEFGERLVTLCDGRPGLRGALEVEILLPSESMPSAGCGICPPQPEETGRAGGALAGADGRAAQPAEAGPAPALARASATIDFIASSEALDRYEEILSSTGWRLENYRRNPVFQNAHQYGDIIFTLGKAVITEIRSINGRSALFQRIEFALDANPMARIAYGLYRGKFLNAVSVGFIPIRWENGSPDAAYRRRYLEQELLEVSAVGIPANPEALQLGLKAGAVQKGDLKELLDLLGMAARAAASGAEPAVIEPGVRSSLLAVPGEPLPIFSDPAAPYTHARASGVWRNEAQLLRLARALRDVLRRS